MDSSLSSAVVDTKPNPNSIFYFKPNDYKVVSVSVPRWIPTGSIMSLKPSVRFS